MRIKHFNLSGFGKFKDENLFTFADSGIQIVTGKNGSGKTTLFRALLGIFTGLPPMEKELYLNGYARGELLINTGKKIVKFLRDYRTDEIEIFNIVDGTEKSVYVGKSNYHTQPEPNYLKILSKQVENLDLDTLSIVSFISRQQLTGSPDMIFRRVGNNNNRSNLNMMLHNAQKSYLDCFGNGNDEDEKQSRLTAYEQQLHEKQKIVDRINSHMLRQQSVNEEIGYLERQYRETEQAEEIQIRQLHRLEKLCEYINQENQINESFAALKEQKDMVQTLEKQLTANKEELGSKYPELYKIPALKLKEDIHRWRELTQKKNEIEKQLLTINHERTQVENEVAKEGHLYQNVGPGFSMELTQYRKLSDEEQEIHRSLKLLFFKIDSGKRKLTHIQLFNLVLIMTGIVLISVFQRQLNFSYSLIFVISALTFCLALFTVDRRIWNSRRTDIEELERSKNDLEEKIKALEFKRQEMGLRYYRLQDIDKTDQHIAGYSNYKEKLRKLDELITRSNILRAQLTTPAFEETSTYYETLYGKQIDIDDPYLMEKIDKVIEYQQEIASLEHALKTLRRKETLELRESDLFSRRQAMKKQIEGFLLENKQLRHLMENNQAINDELRFAEEKIEELDRRQNQLAKEIQQKKIDLASISDFGGINLMHLQEDVRFLTEKIQQLKQKKEVMEIIINSYASVRKDYNKNYRQGLNHLLNERFRKLSSPGTYTLSLMEDMRLQIRNHERDVKPEQMSETMQMLLSMAIRFAWIKHLSDQIKLPVFLDDPLIGFDSERRTAIMQLLQEMSHEHQIVYFTIGEIFQSWGENSICLP